MRRYTSAVIALFVLGLLAWMVWPGQTGAPPPPPPADRLPEEIRGDTEPVDESASIAEPKTEPQRSGKPEIGASGIKPPGPSEPSSSPGSPVKAPGEAAGETAPPAFRPNPRTPPAPKPGSRPLGGSRPPMGPTGLWEKFPPEIARGRASVRVTVFDRDGEPMPGADVYVGHPDIVGNSAVSFGDLRKIGSTDEDGSILGEALPGGAAAVAANFGNMLNGRRGLDATSAVGVVLVADKVAEAEVQLPLALSGFGAIRGVVTGPSGEPVKSASVAVGFTRVHTDAAGSFEIPQVPAGEIALTVSRSGYLTIRHDTEVPAGGAAEVKLALEYREPGSIDLVGTVVGPAGEPVPGATVYVIVSSGRGGGTIRSGLADDHGRFAMESLPDRLRESSVRIQANGAGYRAGNSAFESGLSGEDVTIILPQRLTRLRLSVVDSATGKPLTRCRLEARLPDQERPVASFSSRSESGTYETWLPPGEVAMLVEAPDHEPREAILIVGAGGGMIEHVARMIGVGDGTGEVLLVVRVIDAVSGEPVETASLRVVDEGGSAVASFTGMRPGGVFNLPIPPAARTVAVAASGYREQSMALDLDPEMREAEVTFKLIPE